jgi:hypothetical protein
MTPMNYALHVKMDSKSTQMEIVNYLIPTVSLLSTKDVMPAPKDGIQVQEANVSDSQLIVDSEMSLLKVPVLNV